MGFYSTPDAQLVVGIAIAGYGLFVLTSSLVKMEAVRNKWREKKGDVIYIFTFSAAAVVLGSVLIVRALDQYSFNFS